MSPDRILQPKIYRKLRKWSSQVADIKLWTSEKIAIAELRSCGCGATFLWKVAELCCGIGSFKLRNCDCGLKKSCACPSMLGTLKALSIIRHTKIYMLGLSNRLYNANWVLHIFFTKCAIFCVCGIEVFKLTVFWCWIRQVRDCPHVGIPVR
jgi:hypothetical protein